jgi:hypothetical protein
MDMLIFLKVMLIVQLFFGTSMTIMVYILPSGSIHGIEAFQDYGSKMSTGDISNKIQAGLQTQTKSPIVEVAALVFYSGNMLIDLLLNFLFAVPEMMTLLVSGVSMLVSFDPYMVSVIQVFVGVLFSVLYLVGIIQLVASIRTGTKLI